MKARNNYNITITRRLLGLLNVCVCSAALGLSSAYAQTADSLSLRQAIEEGLAQNFGIKIAKAQAAIAANNNYAGNAGMLPTANFSFNDQYSITNTQQSFFNGTERNINGASANNLNASIMVNWTVFDGFTMFVAKERLAQLEQLGKIELQNRVEGLTAQIIVAYSGIVQQQRLIRVLEQALALTAQRLQLAQSKVAVGSGSRVMLLQAQVDQSADSAALINQKLNLKNAIAEFNTLIGRAPQSPLRLQDVLPALNLPNLPALQERLQSQNPMLRALRQRERLAEMGIKQANAAFYPQINVFTAGNFSASFAEAGILKSARNLGPLAGISANFPLFSGGVNKRNAQNARTQTEIVRLQYQDTLLALESALLQAYNRYETNLQLVQLERQNLKAAEENLAIAMEKYKIGASTEIELRDTQLKLMEAENRALTAQFHAVLSATESLRIAGSIQEFAMP